MNPKNGEAKKTLEKINNRLKTKVAWTLERPKNASKIKFEALEITEKNAPKLVETPNANLKIEAIEEIKEENEIKEVPQSEAKIDEQTNESNSEESTKEKNVQIELVEEELGNKKRRLK